VFVSVVLREGVPVPRDAPWIEPGTLYLGEVILVADREAAVRIHGPAGERCVMSTRDVRRIADDWPDH
jgi:hypothetical protein